MEFCPKCGAMMLPSDGVLKCKSCGPSDDSDSKIDEYKVSEKIEANDNVKYVEDLEPGEGVTEICPKCGHDKATYELKQTRSADEAPTRFFTCLKCKYKWREYD